MSDWVIIPLTCLVVLLIGFCLGVMYCTRDEIRQILRFWNGKDPKK